MKKTKKNLSNNTKKKEIKDTRIECRLTEKQKTLIQKKSKACGISASHYMVLRALDKNQSSQQEKLVVYTIVTLAQDLVQYVQNRYKEAYDDKFLNEKVDELWEKLL